jgi:hypothetical protein
MNRNNNDGSPRAGANGTKPVLVPSSPESTGRPESTNEKGHNQNLKCPHPQRRTVATQKVVVD